jgi:radical SAM superfamily enzyme YgiQ (UPF0313 family)
LALPRDERMGACLFPLSPPSREQPDGLKYPMRPVVLLVNPNRYRNPPVIPLAMEYLAHALKEEGFEARSVDLCFEDDPEAALEAALARSKPLAVCVTVRNVDSVLYPDTEFFLPDIRGHIARVREKTEAPVIIGGAALPADPRGILGYLGADAAVVGPGERTLPALLRELRDARGLRGRGMVLKGEPPGRLRPERAAIFDYPRYLGDDGVAGFQTHKGCSWGCPYCVEARSAVSMREPGDVVHELRALAERSFTHLHLCDPEFNEDHGYCLRLLEEVAREVPGLRWALYMKPGNFSAGMFELLGNSGAYLVTLSVDTLQRPPRYWKDIREMTALARENGIRLAVDFLAGFPGEGEEVLQRALGFLAEARPDEVVVNVFLRLYRNLTITRRIQKDPGLRKYLLGPLEGPCLEPVFYNHIRPERLRQLLGGEAMFRIAGQEKVVNYQKARSSPTS